MFILCAQWIKPVSTKIVLCCWVQLLCISTREHMRKHAFAWFNWCVKRQRTHHGWWMFILAVFFQTSKKLKFFPDQTYEQPAFGCQPAIESHSQLLTNKLFSSFFFVSLLWASRVHDEKDTFFMIVKCFWLFSTMRTHAQACIHWSKYTTCSTPKSPDIFAKKNNKFIFRQKYFQNVNF